MPLGYNVHQSIVQKFLPKQLVVWFQHGEFTSYLTVIAGPGTIFCDCWYLFSFGSLAMTANGAGSGEVGAVSLLACCPDIDAMAPVTRDRPTGTEVRTMVLATLLTCPAPCVLASRLGRFLSSSGVGSGMGHVLAMAGALLL